MSQSRSWIEINADIEASARRYKALIAERDNWLATRIQGVCAAFDAGRTIDEIASAFSMTPAAVRGMLWRAKRSVRRRADVEQRKRLHSIVERHATAVPQP